MPPAREKARERRLESIRGEVERRDVGPQMVDGDEREAPCPRERLCGRDPDEERPDQPRPLRDTHPVHVPERDPCVVEGGADHGGHELEVPPGGDFRNDTAVALVEVGLRGHDRRQDHAFGGDERSRRLVARRLEAEDHEASMSEASIPSASASRHMMRASSRLSV